jgi:hypothetical protein
MWVGEMNYDTIVKEKGHRLKPVPLYFVDPFHAEWITGSR